ncbi:hypothetical protein TrLO_g14612 [Triparma laevis f. longispina]|uniref:Uncharacterized protein n=1 Tax=Triparma laevis f. longispina TaxID=1714387 RepID=A0A9W7E314_9STRA|nr:hypothetical protein TrLO_g14612 [Triparma laevis f. longispina]
MKWSALASSALFLGSHFLPTSSFALVPSSHIAVRSLSVGNQKIDSRFSKSTILNSTPTNAASSTFSSFPSITLTSTTSTTSTTTLSSILPLNTPTVVIFLRCGASRS